MGGWRVGGCTTRGAMWSGKHTVVDRVLIGLSRVPRIPRTWWVESKPMGEVWAMWCVVIRAGFVVWGCVGLCNSSNRHNRAMDNNRQCTQCTTSVSRLICLWGGASAHTSHGDVVVAVSEHMTTLTTIIIWSCWEPHSEDTVRSGAGDHTISESVGLVRWGQ